MLNAESLPTLVQSASPVLGNIGEPCSKDDLSLHGRVQDPLATPADRRRPGRPYIKNSHLIRLLRDPAAVGDPDLVHDSDDGLRAAKGIIVGLLLSIPIWTLITLLGYALYIWVRTLF